MWRAALIFLMLINPALAEEGVLSPFDNYEIAPIPDNSDMKDPPPQYRVAPYLSKPVIWEVAFPKIREVCSGFRARYGCAIPAMADDGTAVCNIYVAKEMKAYGEFFIRLLIHEDAHCRGWPADHPDH